MKIEFGARTDVGMLRTENQDSYGVSESNRFYFVCDGMGGGAAGDFASRYAAEVILKAFGTLTPQELARVAGEFPPEEKPKRMVAAVRLANRALFNFAEKFQKLKGMGTTFVGVLFDDQKELMHIFHVGDSRLYRIRNGVMTQLTKDHSKVNELIEQGKMTEDEVKTTEIQSMITRALGIYPCVKVDYRVEVCQPDDYYVLCSDGLNGELSDPQIKKVVLECGDDVEQAGSRLIEAANRAGGRDNTTVIVLRTRIQGAMVQGQSRDAVTIDEETPQQSSGEDKALKKVLPQLKNKVPDSAKEKSLIFNPLFIGMMLALAVAGTVFAVSRLSLQKAAIENENKTDLVDLAGRIAGIRLEVRMPSQEQFLRFKEAEDAIQRLQLIQDWKSGAYRDTVFLKNVEVVVERNGREEARVTTGLLPLEINLSQGNYNLKLNYLDYRVVTDRLEPSNSIAVAVELSEDYTQVVLLMVPPDRGGK